MFSIHPQCLHFTYIIMVHTRLMGFHTLNNSLSTAKQCSLEVRSPSQLDEWLMYSNERVDIVPLGTTDFTPNHD